MALTGSRLPVRHPIVSPIRHDRRIPPVARRRALRGPAAGWVVLILGAALSVTAALAWRAQAQAQVKRSFEAEAAAVGSAVTTSLLRMDDLTAQARARITSYPHLTNRGLSSWYSSLGGNGRYPGI